MKVVLLTDMCARGAYWQAGNEYDLPDDDAKALIRTGQAVEVMMITPPENAAQKLKKQRR